MKNKSRSFSIYLLKQGFNKDNALKDGHPSLNAIKANYLPGGSSLFLLDTKPYTPWWKDYWGINQDVQQVSKGAIVFVPVKDKCFALTFGHTYHYLKEDAYEYDFGIRTTLNSLDPEKLKSTDILNPENSRRQRIQSPTDEDITFFDFDHDSSIINRLTGKVKKEYKGIFTNATGSSNLSISSNVQPSELLVFLNQLLDIYLKIDYQITFPNIHNITPVRDPIVISELNKILITAFANRVPQLVLSIPDIVNYDGNLNITFSGAGRKGILIFPDVYIDNYRDYLSANTVQKITIQDIAKKHYINLCDDDGNSKNSYSIFKSLIFECVHNAHQYHLCDGNWYKIDDDYVNKLKGFLDPYFYTEDLFPNYTYSSEGVYNEEVAKANQEIVCLDRTNISPIGQTQIEPCDLFFIQGDKMTLCHIKLSTRSSTLSHLFNQGVNAVEILHLENESKEKLKKIVNDKSKIALTNTQLATIEEGKIRIIYGIITHKPSENKSLNLPIFSKISLKRALTELKAMGVDAKICYIKDDTTRESGKPKKRKRKIQP
ncbi:MAG: TIGR04141 family sporadically distributed protein [Prevotella sp.]|jgi:uncharacterized protein (TIGR04141 family)|nr:TIGR04141 family sporadically distributed protein [Prevotella sp.]